MPQVYRRHSEQIQRASPEPRRRSSLAVSPQLTDADDSIVLSDLVRTGEASRLRRRGAMRLDHGGATRPNANSTLPSIALSGPPAAPRRPFALTALPPRPITPPWAAPDVGAEDSEDIWRWTGTEEPNNNFRPLPVDEQSRAVEIEEDEESFVLYCGGEVSQVPSMDYSKPFEQSPLPLPKRSSPARSDHHASPSTNGCGAIIHLRAFPQKTRGVWVGKLEATDSVAALDSTYFERSIVAQMMKSACGCVREGVGCAVCGNPLGTRYKPCQAASEGIFTSRNKHPSPTRRAGPLHPSGPRYWGSSRASSISRSHRSEGSSERSPSSTFYVYTFFADHVSSSPACPFPLSERTERQPLATSPPLQSGAWLGYTPSTSPRPYSPAFAPNPASREPASVPPLNIPPRRPPRRSPSVYETFGLREPAAGYYLSELPEAEPRPTDVDDEDRGSVDPREIRGGLDADGVLVETEVIMDPGSPDKEVMTWPGR
jgi:hypothetical protein